MVPEDLEKSWAEENCSYSNENGKKRKSYVTSFTSYPTNISIDLFLGNPLVFAGNETQNTLPSRH